MAKNITPPNPVPDSLELWVAEIAMAFKGAEQFMRTPLVSLASDFEKLEPWHIAPLMALGARGLVEREGLLDDAAGYAFENFEANYGLDQSDVVPPEVAFAFVYVGAHLGIDLIDEAQADQVMDVVEANSDTLATMIAKAAEMLKKNNPFEFMVTGGAVAPAAAPRPPRAKPARKGAKKAPASLDAKDLAGKVFVLEIELADIEPRIWRRASIPGDFTLAQLHKVIQILFGWEDYHLHEFKVGRQRYAPKSEDDDDWGDEPPKLENKARLREVAPAKGSKFTYLYDFGDSWEHKITVKEIQPPAEEVAYPVCETGERAAPPEDCGGLPGYMNILDQMAKPKAKRDQYLMDWLGENFDPAAFDLSKINQQLRKKFTKKR